MSDNFNKGQVFGLIESLREQVSQLEQERADLQNKPSWDEHNYNFICQNNNGRWFGYDIEPIENQRDQCWMHKDKDFMWQGRRHHICSGEVLGDWRDTLEKRPEQRELNPPTKERNGLESLPLIGEEYELTPYWHKVTIIAHHVSEEGTRIVFWDHQSLAYGYSHRPDYFRTFKTHKEKWVDQAVSLYHSKQKQGLYPFSGLRNIYDAMQSGELPTPKGEKKCIREPS